MRQNILFNWKLYQNYKTREYYCLQRTCSFIVKTGITIWKSNIRTKTMLYNLIIYISTQKSYFQFL